MERTEWGGWVEEGETRTNTGALHSCALLYRACGTENIEHRSSTVFPGGKDREEYKRCVFAVF